LAENRKAQQTIAAEWTGNVTSNLNEIYGNSAGNGVLQTVFVSSRVHVRLLLLRCLFRRAARSGAIIFCCA
jgi:hypothetical protein